MPEYLSPGVYVEEVSSGIKPIEGVGTSTGAFIGLAERGPIKKPVLVTNWTQFTATFGGFIDNGYLAYAVFQFFNEGGTRCYVVRAAKGTSEQLKRAEKAFNDLTVRASSEGEWGNNIKIKIDDESPLRRTPSERRLFQVNGVLQRQRSRGIRQSDDGRIQSRPCG